MEPRPAAAQPTPPAQIGNYRIVRLIAEGGMGTVYEAEQENPRRVVALKLLKPGLASADYLRRFEHEAQILGRLQHPGIAQIYEAGSAVTAAGEQPYFAMEFVDGQTLSEFMEEHQLDTRRRVELMVKVCEAVHHAHQKGVIHRDLKPANILVEPGGQPKVLDFGVARLTDADLQHVTRQTNLGQIVGTLPYMSPEQVAADTLDLDVRSDVYALGVILYELLAGHLPYNLTHLPLHEVVRIIREVEPTTLGTKSRLLRGDLETITAKALEKEKGRRYSSAQELADDLVRFLRHEPIVARPPSTAYQVRKFARRNRVLVGGIAAVFLALVAGVVVSVSYALDARAAQKLADQRYQDEQAAKQLAVESKEATEVALKDSAAGNQFLWDLLLRADPNISAVKDMSVRALLREATQILDAPGAQMTPEVERVVRLAISRACASLSEPVLAERHARRALDLALALGDSPMRAGVIMDCKAQLGIATAHRGNYAEAEVLLAETVRYGLATHGLDSLFTARVQSALSSVLYNLNRPKEAEDMELAALAAHRIVFGPGAPETAKSLTDLAFFAWTRRDLATAETYGREALDILESRGLTDRPAHARALLQLARVRTSQHKYDDAERDFRRALQIAREFYGAEHTEIADALSGLAEVRLNRGENAECQPLVEECLAIRRRILGDHRDTASILSTLAEIHARLGDPERALAESEEALAMRRAIYGEKGPAVGDSLRRIGSHLRRLGRTREAEQHMRDARAMWVETLDADHLDLAEIDKDLAELLREDGRAKEAIPISRECLERRARLAGDTSYVTLQARDELVITLLAAEDWDGARAFCEQMLGLYAEKLRPDHPLPAYTRIQLGRALVGLGRAEEAVELAVEGWSVVQGVAGVPLASRIHTLEWLIEIHAAAGRAGEAAGFRSELDTLRP